MEAHTLRLHFTSILSFLPSFLLPVATAFTFAMSLFHRANDALSVNPISGVDEALSVHGSDWLWAVTAIYLASFVSLALPKRRQPPQILIPGP
jgi:hypothetical protein